MSQEKRITVVDYFASLLAGGFIAGGLAYGDSKVPQTLIESESMLFFVFFLGMYMYLAISIKEKNE